jgi:hypothetical protein
MVFRAADQLSLGTQTCLLCLDVQVIAKGVPEDAMPGIKGKQVSEEKPRADAWH